MLMLHKLRPRNPSPMTMIFSQRPLSRKLPSLLDSLKKSWLWKALLRVLINQMKSLEGETSYLKKWNKLLLKSSRTRSLLLNLGSVSNKLNTPRKKKESKKPMRRTELVCSQQVHFLKRNSEATWQTSKKKQTRSRQPLTTMPLYCKDAITSTTELILAQNY